MKCKRLTALLLSLVMCLGLIGSASASTPKEADQFPDFNSQMWYAEAVTAVVENGLLIGTDEGLLKPNGELTRAEMAAVINRAFGAYKTTDVSEFTDVKRFAWYSKSRRMSLPGNVIRREGIHLIPSRGLIFQPELQLNRAIRYIPYMWSQTTGAPRNPLDRKGVRKPGVSEQHQRRTQ